MNNSVNLENIAFDYSYPFSIKFKTISRLPKSWDEEVVETARYIKSKTPKPIIIALSGGIDSEVVCRAFLKAGIDFTVVTVKYKDNLNSHDIEYAERFCKKFNIKQTYIDMDPFDFYENGIQKYINEGYKSTNLFRYLQLFLLEIIDNMGGCAILGGGEQIYYDIDNIVQIEHPESLLVSLEWTQNKNSIHFPYFFQTTPELTAAYLNHELIKLLTADPKYYKCEWWPGYSAEKTILYHSVFTDMERRRKFNGFENINKFRNTKQTLLKEKFPVNLVYTPISLLRTQLGI
jgi:hypothetical protein